MTTPSKDARKSIAIAGLGAIGAMHLERILRGGTFRVSGLADPSPRAEALARDCGAPWYDSLEALLQADRPDGLIIATPTADHRRMAEECLALGIPVLVEKPVTDTLAAARALVQAEARSGVPVLVGYHRRHNPILRQAEQIIQAGTLGVPVSATVMAAFRKPGSYFDAEWHRKPGAGPILINLTHDIDMLRLLLGEVDSVQALASHRVRGYEVEDTAAALMQFRCGALVTLMTSDCATGPWNWDLCAGEAAHYPQQPANTHFICGTEASLSLPGLELWRYRGEEKHWHAPLSRESTAPHRGDPYMEQLAHFDALIDGKVASRCSALDGLLTLQATLAVHEACRSGSRVQLEPESSDTDSNKPHSTGGTAS